MADYSIGVDLGGTNLRAASVDRNGAMLEKISGTTGLGGNRDAESPQPGIRQLQFESQQRATGKAGEPKSKRKRTDRPRT